LHNVALLAQVIDGLNQEQLNAPCFAAGQSPKTPVLGGSTRLDFRHDWFLAA
jgi:hypothetical protein